MKNTAACAHVQGSAPSLPLLRSDKSVTGAAGLLLLRRLWDRWEIGAWLDRPRSDLPGRYRPSLFVEQWIVLYGGGWMSDLEWFGWRGVRRLFGWVGVPASFTFGRWLRRAGKPVAEIIAELIRRIVRLRWEQTGMPASLSLVLDSTVILRYG